MAEGKLQLAIAELFAHAAEGNAQFHIAIETGLRFNFRQKRFFD
jgi:hypothetical protein